MANTINFILTNAAEELISKVLNGKTLNFTRMAVGDGFSYDENVAKGFTTLVNEVLSLEITKKEIENSSTVKITSAFTSSDVQKKFYYREVGLFAQDPDTGQEVLYAYGNRNEAAELITPAGLNIITKQLAFIVSVGDSANVTFKVNADVYALQEDMLGIQSDITTLQANLDELNSTKANQSKQNELEARMNTFVAVGSTSDNAETTDIRIGADGITYSSAGDSIRGQFNKVKASLVEYEDRFIYVFGFNIFDKSKTSIGYYDYRDGSFKESAIIYHNELLPIKENTTYFAQSFGGGMHITFWNSDKKFLSGLNLTENTSFVTPSNTKFYSISLENTRINIAMIFEGTSTISSYVPYSGGYKSKSSKRIIRVANDGKECDYVSVAKAVENAVSGDIIHVLNGVYDNEVIRGFEKDITIIGENPLKTIIKNTYSSYDKPPIEFSKGAIINLTFHAEYNGTEPTDANGRYAYAMHCDNLNMSNGKLYVENCIFKSDKNAGLGLGMWGGWSGIFKDCRFICGAVAPIYNHDCVIDEYLGEQRVSYVDCIFENNNNVRPFWLQSYQMTGNTIYYEFIRNVFKVTGGEPLPKYENSNRGGATTVGTFNSMINCYKVGTSSLNTIASLNV